MKRPHRRIHLLMWLFIGPATAVAAFVFWTMRPSTPFTEIPESIRSLPTTPKTKLGAQ